MKECFWFWVTVTLRLPGMQRRFLDCCDWILRCFVTWAVAFYPSLSLLSFSLESLGGIVALDEKVCSASGLGGTAKCIYFFFFFCSCWSTSSSPCKFLGLLFYINVIGVQADGLSLKTSKFGDVRNYWLSFSENASILLRPCVENYGWFGEAFGQERGNSSWIKDYLKHSAEV